MLIPRVKEIFHQLYNRRLLIRLIGVRFSHNVHGNYQIDMFDDTEQRIQLYQAIDKVNRSYGKDGMPCGRNVFLMPAGANVKVQNSHIY